jgi:hypothetical protein
VPLAQRRNGRRSAHATPGSHGTRSRAKSASLLPVGSSAAMRARGTLRRRRPAREKSKERSGAMYRLGPPYAEALLAKGGELVSPDANSTLRVTYGTVTGVEPRDGLLYLP